MLTPVFQVDEHQCRTKVVLTVGDRQLHPVFIDAWNDVFYCGDAIRLDIQFEQRFDFAQNDHIDIQIEYFIRLRQE